MKSSLVIDVGNTSTSLGLYREGAITRTVRIESGKSNAAAIRKAVAKVVGRTSVDRAVGATVVPKAQSRWTTAVKQELGQRLYWITHRSELGVPITYPDPSSIGPDRLANASAAATLYGAPVVVADFGTALTFDIVSRRGGYTGGIIAPGLPLMFSYLADQTALLPYIEPGPVKGMVGKSTEEAMRIGARYGYRGMVREILENLRKRLRQPDLKVCATGGYAGWVLKGMAFDVVVNPDLTLFGIGHIGELNSG